MSFTKVEPKDFVLSPFEEIGKNWILITVKDGEKVNTMTASWGGFGVYWSRNCAFIFVRDSRYSKHMLDNAATFTVSMMDPEKWRKTESYLGTASGRDEDKLAKAGLTVSYEDETPYLNEATYNITCTKLCAQKFDNDNIVFKDIVTHYYPQPEGGYHTLYVGQIKSILKKEN